MVENTKKDIDAQSKPNAKYFIEHLFRDYIQLSGDRFFGDDPAVIGGIAYFDSIPVTVIGQLRGRNTNEQLTCNFSMSMPEGYRKIQRLMKQAEKFHRPVICFVDTIGAYPGKEAEDRGQGMAIANCIMESTHLATPIISILIGNSYSGGALALSISDMFIAFEYATIGVASPKACANILWKDSSRTEDIINRLQVHPSDLLKLGIIDIVIPDDTSLNNPVLGLHNTLKSCLKQIAHTPTKKLIYKRLRKYRYIGRQFLCN